MTPTPAAPNLAPAPLLFRRRRTRRLGLWARVLTPAVLAGAIFTGWGAWASGRIEAQGVGVVTRAEDRRADILADLEDLRRRYDAAIVARSDAATLERQPDWGLFLAVISGVCDEDIRLREFRLERIDTFDMVYRVRLAGRAPDQRGVSRFALRLEQLGVFRRVRVGESSRRGDDGVAFSLTAELAEPEDGVRIAAEGVP